MGEGDNMAAHGTHANGDLQTSCPRTELHLCCMTAVMLLAVKNCPDSADMPECLLDRIRIALHIVRVEFTVVRLSAPYGL